MKHLLTLPPLALGATLVPSRGAPPPANPVVVTHGLLVQPRPPTPASLGLATAFEAGGDDEPPTVRYSAPPTQRMPSHAP